MPRYEMPDDIVKNLNMRTKNLNMKIKVLC